MIGRITILCMAWGLLALGESPVRGKYIKPPTVAKPSVTPSPTPTAAATAPCEPNMLSDTCRIPSSDPAKDPMAQKPDASAFSSKTEKPDAKVDPIKKPSPSPIPPKPKGPVPKKKK